MSEFPTGIVSLVFTDIQDSADLWERYGAAFKPVLDTHCRILREALTRWRGYQVEREGDSFFITFARASDAVWFAVDAQRALAAYPWPSLLPGLASLRVRIGIHTGEVLTEREAGEQVCYYGPAVNRAARVSAAGHGGQILASDACRTLALPELSAKRRIAAAAGVGTSAGGAATAPDLHVPDFLDLGTHQLKGIGEERLWQVDYPGSPSEFPPLKSLSIARAPHGRQHLLGHGAVLGSYEILEELGRGGLGVVYKARHLHLARTVAVKVLHPQGTAAPDFMERFREEGRVMALLEHPNILRIYDAAETDGTFYLVMSYLEGWTLESLMTRSVPVTASLEIIGQVARALAYAHSRGVIHRDVKPANIMVSPQGAVTLMDLGLARMKDAPGTTLPGMRMGTPFYMSPEQAAGGPVDSRSDLYALGVILYQLLSGALPFPGPSTEAVYRGHLQQEPPALGAQHPEWLHRVVRKALAKRPEERFQCAGDLLLALESRGAQGLEVAVAPAEPRRDMPPTAASPEARREERTVLALDVVGSSHMKTPGRTVAIQQQFALFRRYVRAHLETHHALASLWAGDGLLALFTHPTEGVACAVALLSGLAAFNAEGAGRWEPLQVRVSVFTGAVRMQPGQPLGEVVSRTLDSARHLLKSCPPDAVLLGEPAWERLLDRQSWMVVDEPYARRFPFQVYRYAPGGPVEPATSRAASEPANTYLLRIQVTTGDVAQQREVRDEAIIGRPGGSRPPQIEITGDDAVSRRHARLFMGADGYYVEDLDSANGTSLNDCWLQPSEPVRLKVGDTVALGEGTSIRVLSIQACRGDEVRG